MSQLLSGTFYIFSNVGMNSKSVVSEIGKRYGNVYPWTIFSI
jgi:hypothetical protein